MLTFKLVKGRSSNQYQDSLALSYLQNKWSIKPKRIFSTRASIKSRSLYDKESRRGRRVITGVACQVKTIFNSYE